MLTPKVLTISQAYLSSNSLPRIAQPFLDRASRAAGDPCSLGVLQDDFVIHVASSSSPTLSNIQRGVGAHLPAYCTAVGRVILAHATPSALDEYFARVDLKPITPKTICEEAELRSILKQVADEGYCFASGETSLHIQALAVPVYNARGAIRGAIGVMNVKDGMEIVEGQDFIRATLPLLRKTANEISALLVD